MEHVLKHYYIDGAYGWNQDWFPDFFMRLGGCAAVTACDACVYFALRHNRKNLVAFDPRRITRADYLNLSREMKRVLGPRMRGVDRLEIYQEGLGEYFREIGETQIHIGALHGAESYETAQKCLVNQIDNSIPVPFLLLRHADPALDFYTWHWFLLMGYDNRPDSFFVQAVTYGSARWLNFRRLWNTGYDEKGGMILFSFT